MHSATTQRNSTRQLTNRIRAPPYRTVLPFPFIDLVPGDCTHRHMHSATLTDRIRTDYLYLPIPADSEVIRDSLSTPYRTVRPHSAPCEVPRIHEAACNLSQPLDSMRPAPRAPCARNLQHRHHRTATTAPPPPPLSLFFSQGRCMESVALPAPSQAVVKLIT